MKLLWLSNGPIPQAADVFEMERTNVEGWKIQIYEKLQKENDITSIYMFPSQGTAERKTEAAIFSTFDCNADADTLVTQFTRSLQEFMPDVIHIWGTEYIHSYAMTEAAKKLGMSGRVVISIQGLVSMYYYHYMGGIPAEVQNAATIRDLLKRDTLKIQQNRFLIRGQYEWKAIQNVKHVIGRTFWDKASTKLINPNIVYHFNNETLRESFYHAVWDIHRVEKHSIFVSQAYYPLKGFHNVLIAANYLKKKYVDLKIYVSGADNAFITGLKAQSYGKYIQKLIRKYNLENQVVYLGRLNEKQMVNQYLQSNVFVSASSIENSPNSVGEAMVLGMPVVSSNVGGVADMLKHNEEGFLYQADAPYLLAYYLDQLFMQDDLQQRFGENARRHALRTHDLDTNYMELLRIYNVIGETYEN